MPKTTIKGDQIRDGEVKTVDLSGEAITEDKLADAATSALKFTNLAVTDSKLALRTITTGKLADDYVLDGDVVDVGGTTFLTLLTIGVETRHFSVTEVETAPTTDTDGIPLDGASHVTWAFADSDITSATYQGWLYTTALGWIQIPSVSGSITETFSGELEVSGAERFALPLDTFTGTSVLKIFKAVTA